MKAILLASVAAVSLIAATTLTGVALNASVDRTHCWDTTQDN
jgi:hypothetical protein